MKYSPKIQMLLREQFPLLISLLLLAVAAWLHLFESLFGISRVEEIALIILLTTALFWILEAIPLYITSLGVLLMHLLWLLPALEQAGIEAGRDDFFLAFFGDITLLFMGGFVLSSLLNKYGLARLMAEWMLRRTGQDPARVLLGIIAIASVLSMWMSNTATAAMMFAIVGPILSRLPGTSTFAKGLALAIPFACNLGGLGTPIGTPPNAIAMEYLHQAGIKVTFIGWMLYVVPLMLLLLFLLWRTLLYFFPPGALKIQFDFEEDTASFSIRQYMVVAIFVLTVLGWLTSGATGLSAGTIGLMVVIVSFGLNLLSTRDFRGISWDILFMLGGGLCLGVGLKVSGLTGTISGNIPIAQGWWIAFGVLVLLASVMTTFMSNTATANLLIPVAVSLPQNELIFALSISIMCSSAMAMPVSTPPNAIAFGSGLIDTRDMIRGGGVITFLALAATVLASVFYFPLFA